VPRRARSKRPRALRYRRCRLLREAWEEWRVGLCPACTDRVRQARRRQVGARILGRSTEAGLEERDGDLYRVVVLPPTRRRKRRR
jgi:hypothetical protein